MSDRSRGPAGRLVWQPKAVQRPVSDADALPAPDGPQNDPGPRSAEVWVLTPAQDRETADLSRELVASRLEAQTLAATSTPTKGPCPRTPEPAQNASPPEQRPMASDAAPHRRRPTGWPTSRPDLPSTALPGETLSRDQFAADIFTATAAEAKQARRRRKLALLALALSVILGGLGFGYVAYAPENAGGPELASLPDTAPADPTPPPEPTDPVDGLLETLQLEAREPSTAPLLERDIVAGPIRRPPAAKPSAIAFAPEVQLILVFQNTDSASADADRVRTTLATLTDPPAIALRSVDFTIATPRVRYFYADDATAAAALADLLGPPSNGAGTWQVQDFTHFRPGPTEGTLEVFISNPGG